MRYINGKRREKAGGWLSKIAKLVKPRQIVGRVLTEEQVGELLKP